MTSAKCAIGVDLGGTKIEVARVGDAGEVQQKMRLATDAAGGATAVERQIIQAVDRLRDEQKPDPIGVGVGVAGQVVRQTGRVRYAPNLDWHEVPLQQDLQAALGIPVMVTNDVRAATLGEWHYGAGRGCDDFICIFVGTGVGGGIVSGGRMLTGYSNTAGEVGHITVDLHGPICTCGNQGCLESLAGGWAIAREAQKAAATHPQAGAALIRLAGHQVTGISAETVARACREKDPLARRIISGVGEALVGGVVTMLSMCNPRRIILGGGVIAGLPELIGRVEQGIRQRALTAALESLEIAPAELGDEAGVIGAAALVLRGWQGQ
jgi:glucokinase